MTNIDWQEKEINKILDYMFSGLKATTRNLIKRDFAKSELQALIDASYKRGKDETLDLVKIKLPMGYVIQYDFDFHKEDDYRVKESYNKCLDEVKTIILGIEQLKSDA